MIIFHPRYYLSCEGTQPSFTNLLYTFYDAFFSIHLAFIAPVYIVNLFFWQNECRKLYLLHFDGTVINKPNFYFHYL